MSDWGMPLCVSLSSFPLLWPHSICTYYFHMSLCSTGYAHQGIAFCVTDMYMQYIPLQLIALIQKKLFLETDFKQGTVLYIKFGWLLHLLIITRHLNRYSCKSSPKIWRHPLNSGGYRCLAECVIFLQCLLKIFS